MPPCDFQEGSFIDENLSGWGQEDIIGSEFALVPLPVGATLMRQVGFITNVATPPTQDAADRRTTFETAFFTSGGFIIPPAHILDINPNYELEDTREIVIPALATQWRTSSICQPGGGPCPPGRNVLLQVDIFCGDDVLHLASTGAIAAMTEISLRKAKTYVVLIG